MQKQTNARVTHSTTQTNILHRDKKSKIGGGGIGGHGVTNSLTLLQFPKQSSCELPM
jgi:hypothetical protein